MAITGTVLVLAYAHSILINTSRMWPTVQTPSNPSTVVCHARRLLLEPHPSKPDNSRNDISMPPNQFAQCYDLICKPLPLDRTCIATWKW